MLCTTSGRGFGLPSMSPFCDVQMPPKVEEIGQKLARAIKTERDLENINAAQQAKTTNQQHQQSYQKQLKVFVSWPATQMEYA